MKQKSIFEIPNSNGWNGNLEYPLLHWNLDFFLLEFKKNYGIRRK